MKREIVVGSICRKCESLMNLHRLDCPCMRDIAAHACDRWRKTYWRPVYWKAEVTMSSANR